MYSRKTIKEWIRSWLYIAQRYKQVARVHWRHKESQIKLIKIINRMDPKTVTGSNKFLKS